jgi:hypothetical protein
LIKEKTDTETKLNALTPVQQQPKTQRPPQTQLAQQQSARKSVTNPLPFAPAKKVSDVTSHRAAVSKIVVSGSKSKSAVSNDHKPANIRAVPVPAPTVRIPAAKRKEPLTASKGSTKAKPVHKPHQTQRLMSEEDDEVDDDDDDYDDTSSSSSDAERDPSDSDYEDKVVHIDKRARIAQPPPASSNRISSLPPARTKQGKPTAISITQTARKPPTHAPVTQRLAAKGVKAATQLSKKRSAAPAVQSNEPDDEFSLESFLSQPTMAAMSKKVKHAPR